MKRIFSLLLVGLAFVGCSKNDTPTPVTPPVVKIDSSVGIPTNVILTHNFRMCTLRWTSGKGATGYRIYRDTIPFKKKLLVDLGPDKNIYQDTGLIVSKKYYYSISSYNQYKESELYSDSAIVDPAALGKPGNIFVNFSFPQTHFTNLSHTVTFKNDPTNWDGTPNKDGIYIQLYSGGPINGNIGFYYGFQTYVLGSNGISGRGFIFSRWLGKTGKILPNEKLLSDGTLDKITKTTDGKMLYNDSIAKDFQPRAAAYYARTGSGSVVNVGSGENWTVQIAKPYKWSPGTYVVILNKDSANKNGEGDWYSIHIVNKQTNVDDYVGSMIFENGPESGISGGGGSFTETYTKDQPNTPQPNWNITIDKVTGDGVPCTKSSAGYGKNTIGIPMNVWSDITHVIHMDLGYWALRLTDDYQTGNSIVLW